MWNICGTCGYLIPPHNQAIGYAGNVCMYGGHHPTFQLPAPPLEKRLTEDDVRRIVREELDRSPQTTHEKQL